MTARSIICGKCGRMVAPDVSYCPHCGEAVDPVLVNRLRDLHATLQLLDARVASGWADRTVTELRADLVEQYLALRTPPITLIAPVAPAQPVTPVAPPAPAFAPQVTRETGAPARLEASPASAAPVATAPSALSAPIGPAFAWRAFVADQAIAIMAYLGGFLLLVATLAFEVGGWQDLPNAVKLALVVVVYVAFGTLGLLLRHSTLLGTVGRAYLGVFALMTPLVGLAVYRFELQALGFPVSGMVCISSLYAATIFLLLATRTGFVTYAYLGWTALTVGALAAVMWSGGPHEWSFCVLGATSIMLLIASQLRRPRELVVLQAPALHVALVTSIPAALGTLTLTVLAVLYSMGVRDVQGDYAPAAFASAGVVLWLLSLAWSRVAHIGDLPLSSGLLDLVDWLAVAIAPIGVVGVLMWAGAERALVAPAVALVGVLTAGVALVLRRRQPERTRLRFAEEALAAVLTALASAIVVTLPSPNWPLALTLATGIAVTLTVAVVEDTPWVLLTSGFFLTIEYWAVLNAVSPQGQPIDGAALRMLTLGFALSLWALGIGLTLRPRPRAFAWPVQLTALANALLALTLSEPNPAREAAQLGLLAAVALVAGYRLRRPVWAGIVTALFGAGAILVVALSLHLPGITFGVTLGVAVVTLAIRRWLGRRWAFAPYGIALCAALVGRYALNSIDPLLISEPHWLAVIRPGDWLLLAMAIPAAVAALLEDQPWTMAVPALLAYTALLDGSSNPRVQVAIALALVGAGMLLRQVRGRWWSVAWHVAGFGGALVAVRQFGLEPYASPRAQVAVLLAFATLAYLVALQERSVWVTSLSAVLAGLAAELVPLGHTNLLPMLALTFAYALAASALSRWRGSAWALGLYAAAVLASLLAVIRLSPFDPGVAEALLLIFAGAGYLIAVVERRAWAGGAPALYAALAVIVQPDSHALLPLALTLAVGGLVISRLFGLQRAWPLYVGAAVAAIATAVLGTGNLGFEALALVALALVAYLIAVLESRAELVPVALLFGVLALASGSGALQLPALASTLAFIALSWAYVALGRLWRHLPGLRNRGAWWPEALANEARALQLSDPRAAGTLLHEWGGLALGGATVVAALATRGALAVHATGTQGVALALVSLAGLCWLHALLHHQQGARYVAGGIVALALSAEARWLGAANIQAFVLAPGSYFVLAGALLPVDEQLGRPWRLGRAFSLAGAIVLLAPTLAQSLTEDPAWLYALLLTVEALLLAGAGVGMRSRILVLTSTAFVGIAAVRGAALAVTSGVPVALVIAALALLLMGLATWLSLRIRRDASQAV